MEAAKRTGNGFAGDSGWRRLFEDVSFCLPQAG